MKITLLILATLSFHMPLCLLRHTIRKFKKMELYNPELAFLYESNNGSFDDKSTILLGIINLLCGLGFALAPLFVAFDINWLIIIISNSVFLFTISPWIAFFLMPLRSIYTKKALIKGMVMYFAIGLVLFIIGLIIK